MVSKTTGDNSEPNQGEEEKYVSPKQLNDAIAARFRSFETKQTEAMSRIELLLQERQKPVEAATPVDPEAKPAKKVSERDEMLMALQTKMRILEEKEQKAREQSKRLKLQEELIAGRVNPQLVRPLMAQLELEQAVAYESADSDGLIFRIGESVYPLKEGVSAFLSSEDAKPFLAPRGPVGSGEKSYTSKINSKPQAGKLSMEQAGDALLSLITGSGE